MTSASYTMASSKGYNNKNNKKLQEVKEVIQNKSDNDISKILEVFDNDVSKTISAFMAGKKKKTCLTIYFNFCQLKCHLNYKY